jgi:hypothetical protein
MNDLLNLDYSEKQQSFHFDYSLGVDPKSPDWKTVCTTNRKTALRFIDVLGWKYTTAAVRYPEYDRVAAECRWFINFLKTPENGIQND